LNGKVQVDLLAKINFANFSFWMQQNTSTRVKLNEYVRIVIRCGKNKNEKEKEKKNVSKECLKSFFVMNLFSRNKIEVKP
jgi:hypothetical protein